MAKCKRARARPYIVLSLALSLDGQLAPSRGDKKRLGSNADLERLRTLRRWADTLIVGANTIRQIDPPMALRDAKPRVVVFSRKGALSPNARAFRYDHDRPVPWLVTTAPLAKTSPFLQSVADGRLVHHRANGGGRIDIVSVVDALKRAGARRIVVEGGGETAAAFLQADCLDELVLTYAPLVLGGIQHAFGARRDDAFKCNDAPRFRLLHVVAKDDEIYSRWRCNSSTNTSSNF